MTGTIVLAMSLAQIGQWIPGSDLIAPGGDLARGVLINRSGDASPADPPHPDRPTIVFVHGFNPLPRHLHFTMTERLSEAVTRRFGPSAVNVLDWDWNGATFVGLHYDKNSSAAVDQGPLLAAALAGHGLPPERIHLIGHSAGAMVATSAARSTFTSQGRLVAQLTLLEPAGYYHSILFDRLGAATAATRVENYYAPGPSGYGRPARRPGVADYEVRSGTPWLGVIRPTQSSHLEIFRWYVATANDPAGRSGLNTNPWFGQ